MSSMNRSLLQGMTISMLLLIGFPVFVMADLQTGIKAYLKGDYEKATQEFRPLAEEGMAPAQFRLGICYEKGLGVSRDDDQAVKWFRLAADQGYTYA